MPTPLTPRLRNAFSRLRHGLPARGAVVSPEVADDLYVAHLAFYCFAGREVAERRVLDLGCGTGYGAAHLAGRGALEVVAVDRDARLLAYARRRFADRMELRRADAVALPADLGSFDLVVMANVLAQLDDPGSVLASLGRFFAPGGALLASVPPVLDPQTLARDRAAGRHRSTLFLWEWQDLLAEHFGTVRLFRQLAPPGARLDFTSPLPSALRAEDFRFEELPLSELDDVGSLAAIFRAEP